MISVIIPVYNSEKTLKQTLASVASQTYADFEVIIADNGSDDASMTIAEEFTADPRFRVIHCPVRGVSNARNAGIEAAKGSYVFFLDADDLLCPDALNDMGEAAIRENADVVIPNILRKSNRGDSLIDPALTDRKVLQADIPELLRGKLPTYLLHFPFKLYKLELLNKHHIRFDPALSLGEDLIFALDFFAVAECVYCIQRPLYIYIAAFGGLNSRYRDDLRELKFYLCGRIKKYLAPHGKLDDGYYLMLLRDVFALAVNEYLKRNPKGVRELLEYDEVQELNTHSRRLKAGVSGRLVLICIRFRLPRLLYFAAFVWFSLNYKGR